jgi:CSLREA domain-containing protein
MGPTFRHIRARARLAIAAAPLVAAGLAANPAPAALIDVTTTADQTGAAPGCSLRQAITAADLDKVEGGCPKGVGPDTIQLPAGVYKLTLPGAGETLNQKGDLNVQGLGAIAIEPAGSGPVVIDGGDLDRVIRNGGGASLSLFKLTVRNGLLTGMEDGAGVLNEKGTLTLDRVTLRGNRAQAGDGGAVANYAALVVRNSTISGNNATRDGGGLYTIGETTNSLRSVTISGNAADAFGTNTGNGGGIAAVGAASVNATNTILAGNFDNSPPAGSRAPDCATGPNFFPRYTLIGDPSPVFCLVGFNPGTNLTGDPKLGPLGDNGGPTPTRVPNADSPAIDAAGKVAPDVCPGLDQRGVSRPKGAGCDIGAVERDPQGLDAPGGGSGASARLILSKPRPRRARARLGARVRYRLRARNIGDATASRVRVCVILKGNARRTLKPVGRRCRRLGQLDAGRVKVARLRVRVRLGAGSGRVKVRFKLRAADLKPRARAAVLRVR